MKQPDHRGLLHLKVLPLLVRGLGGATLTQKLNSSAYLI